MVGSLNPKRAGEPCCKVERLRGVSPETGELVFDAWCIVHDHWLNGTPAESIVDREIRILHAEGKLPE
mgnify:CR=1 FL=1